MHRGSAATPVANSDQTVGNVLRRHGIPPAPKRGRTTTWAEFIRAHLAVLTGTDFFAVEVLTWRGLVTYYVVFFIHLESRRVDLAGITDHPTEHWMQQMARERDYGRMRRPWRPPLSHSRSRHEVHSFLPGNH
jgi:hypothetical protein